MEGERLYRVLGYDRGTTWVSSNGAPWDGFRKAYLQASTNAANQREIAIHIDEVNERGSTIAELKKAAVLVVEPPEGNEAEIVKIKRSGCLLSDKGRIDVFLERVKQIRRHFEATPGLHLVR